MKYSEGQKTYFDWIREGSGHAMLEAVAGSGKTTTLIHGMKHMVGSVWMGAYNKKIAMALQARIDKTGARGCQASTFHSAGLRTITRKLGSSHIDRDKVLKIAEPMASSQKWTRPACRVISMAKNRGIGLFCPIDDFSAWEKMVHDFNLEPFLPENIIVESQFYRFCMDVLVASNEKTEVVDFDDMVYLPLVKNFSFQTFDWVLIDEAQDTNPTRREMALRLLRPSGRLVAVGDPYQAVYGFTGADNDAMDTLRSKLDATTIPLHVTYRCPKVVTAHAQRWVPHITAHKRNPEGSVERRPYEDLLEIARELKPKSSAILCRLNRPLVETAFMLLAEGIPARIEGQEIRDRVGKILRRWKSVRKLSDYRERFEKYTECELEKVRKLEDTAKEEQLSDLFGIVELILDQAEASGGRDIYDAIDAFRSVFDRREALTLSSVHRSKGLEWNTVVLLGREQFMPSRSARQDWQKDQERNLIYVAVTRSKDRLIEVAYREERREWDS